MAYSLVPDANNTVGSDLTAMQENFSLLESAQVVDEGSTADGDYIRYENGWQICTTNITGTISIDGTSAGGYRSSGINYNFPAVFLENQYKSFAGGKETDYLIILNTGNINDANRNNFALWRATSATDVTYSVDIIAVGRWK